jgi:tRNA(Ile)-lysidine synthase
MLHFADEVLLRDPEAFIEFQHYPQLTSDKEKRISIPGQNHLAYGWTLDVESVQLDTTKRAEVMQETRGRVAVFDEQAVEVPLSLRPPQPGDRIRLLGMEGRTKVSDLFVNQHIPQPARSRWPLVVSGEQVLWVVGVRMNHDARITDSTQRAIVFRLYHPQRNDL